MCQTLIISAQTIPEGWLYWQAADLHCFAELKTSNQISCCTNVIATTAALGVMDNANFLSYETSLNTSVSEMPRWKCFQKICYPGPSEQMLMQSSDACWEWTFWCPWKRLLQQLDVVVYVEEEQRTETSPSFVICSTVCKVPVGLLSSCRYIYNFIFTFLMFATLIQPQKLRGGYMSAEDMFCSQLHRASINTSVILFHTYSTRNARMKPWHSIFSHHNSNTTTYEQKIHFREENAFYEQGKLFLQNTKCVKTIDFSAQRCHFSAWYSQSQKNNINYLYLLWIKANLNHIFFS